MRHGLRLRVLIPLLLAVAGAAVGMSLGLSGEASAAGRDSGATRFVALAVGGSASVSGHSVALTFTVSNIGELPVIGVTLNGAIYQGSDTTEPSGSLVTTFDCELSDDADSPPFIPLGVLVLAPDTSVTCFATLELTPGTYTAWLSACGLFLGDVPRARGAVPFVLLAPPSASPPPMPKPPPPPSPQPPPVTTSHPASPSPNPSVPRTGPPLATSAAPQFAAPPAAPSASVRPHPNSSPPASPTPSPTSLAIVAALAQPAVLPAATEDPARPLILLMILPAAVAAAAALSRRR